jgi:hypothetical protein
MRETHHVIVLVVDKAAAPETRQSEMAAEGIGRVIQMDAPPQRKRLTVVDCTFAYDFAMQEKRRSLDLSFGL